MRYWVYCLFLLLLTELSYAASPQRIVSLDLCTDWMLVTHADEQQVAALSSYIHRYPVAWVDDRWPTHNGSLEQILMFKPDMVLVGEYNAMLLRQRLQELGVRVEVLPLPRTLHDVVSYEQQVLQLLDKPLHKASVQPQPHVNAGKPARLLLLGANGVGTGRGTFEDGVLRYAGWQNYLDDEGYVRLDLERIVLDPPDMIMWSAPRSRALANQFAEHPVLKRLLHEQRWLDASYWHWQCPGPWTWQLIEKMKP